MTPTLVVARTPHRFEVRCDRHRTPYSVYCTAVEGYNRAKARRQAEDFRATHLDFSPGCVVEIVEVRE